LSADRKVERVQVLTSRFKLEDRTVLFGRAKLMADRLVLRGLGFSARIMLEDIVEIRWSGDMLEIECADGENYPMILRAAALWKYELQARCGLKDVNPAIQLQNSREKPKEQAGFTLDIEADTSLSDSLKEEVGFTPTNSGTASNGEEGALRGVEALPDGGGLAEESPNPAQQDMFPQRETSYKIRTGFAEDRPVFPKRMEDPEH